MPRLISPIDWTPRGIESLEQNADTVVRSTTTYSVVAGPGSGKTELLAQRASFLLETGACPAPKRILAISFKRDAAKNLRERVRRRSDAALSRRFDSYTFDAFAKGCLDQFLPALPERLRPTPEYDVLVKLAVPEIERIVRSMEPPPHLGTRRGLFAFEGKRFLERHVMRVSLNAEPTTLEDWVAREFWGELLRGPRSKLPFLMIMRLAGYLLRNDPRLLRAYRATYSHVFLDEFQDTTTLQYALTKLLFKDTPIVLTAVGDPHQRIMGWAGAVKSIFEDFKRDFGAQEIRLQRNHRASSHLAPFVRFLAEQMHASIAEHGGEVPEISPGSGPPPDACAAHVFADETDEAAWIVTQVEGLLAAGVQPRDIALLARIKAADYVQHVIAALDANNIGARVEDALQDALSEPIVDACILGLRALACDRPGTNWSEFRALIGEARGLDADDLPRWRLLESELCIARAQLRRDVPNPPQDELTVRKALQAAVEPFLTLIRVRHSQYARGTFFDDCLNGLAELIAKEARTDRWQGALDRVEGIGTIPVLTIHKSKGLEYEAVFFVGLEDGAFWNFERQPDEEMNAFYVAVSRAKKRVVFTFSRRRTNTKNKKQTISGIGKIYELMQKASIHIESHIPPDDKSTD